MPTLAELSSLSSPAVSMEQEKQTLSSATLANAKRNPFLSTLAGTLQGTVGGGSLTALGNATGALGLKQASEALYRKGTELQADAAPYMAPQLDYRTVHDVGSAVDFGLANMGQGAGSMGPMLLGRALGGAPLGLAAGLLPQQGENVSRIKNDPTLAGMSEAEILGAAAPTAALQTGLDYIVPGGIATKYGRKAATALGTGAAGRAATTVGVNMGVEGGTEEIQEELGMGMHGLLNPNRDTRGDEHARIQSFLGGAVGGAPMGAIDAGVGYVQDKFDAKPPKPLDISAESDGILKSRKPLHPNLTDTEMGEALTQRDAQESAQAEQLAQKVKASPDTSPRTQKLADEFLAGDKSGQAAELFVREVQRADDAEKDFAKGKAWGKEFKSWLNTMTGGRLGNAQDPLKWQGEMFVGNEPIAPAGGYESVDEGKVSSAARSVPNAYGNTGTETEEGIIDKLMLAYRSSDIKKRAEAQAEAAPQINDVSEPLNKWIDLNFGADFNEGEVVVPPQMLKLSDKLDVFVQTLYNNKVRRGEPVPAPEMLQAVIAKINALETAPKYGVDAPHGEQEFDDSNAFESANGDSIGTNEMDQNTISQRKVYTGKSTKADVPYLTDSDTRSLSETMDRLRASGVEPKAVGMWQRAKDELATDTAALRVREDAMLEAKAPADFKRLQSIDVNSLDEVGKKGYDQFRENALKAIDKKYLYIEHEQNEAPEATEVRGEQFRNLKKSPWVVSAKGFEGPEHGTVWFKKADGTQFATSTHKLMKLGRRGQTATEKFGTIEQKEALLAGISSFLNAQETDGKPALDGQFGFANADGKVEWLGNRKAADKSSEEFSLDSGGGKPSITRMVKGGQLPANLKLYSGELGEAKYGKVSAYQRGKEAEAEARMNEDKPAPIDTTDMRKPGLAESPSMGQDRHNPGKPIKRNDDGTEAVGEPSGSLVTTSMTSKRVPPTDAQLERVSGLIQQLATKGVPGTVASAGKDSVERLKTIAGLDKEDELWDGFDPKSRSEVKRRAKAALNVLYRDEADTRTSVPSSGKRAESNPGVEKKPAQPSSLVLPKPSDALRYLTDKVLESLRKKGYVNPRALRGAQYTTLRDTLGDVKGNVDAVFVYDGGDPFSIVTKETIRVGLRTDSVNAETYKKALKQIQKEAIDYEEGEPTSGFQRLGNAMAVDIHNDLGKKGFAATHDSPIKHEGKFDWRKHIGKGEGNAAFGAGTYLSTSEGVHRSYKNQFTAKVAPSHKVNQKPYLERFLSDPNGVDPHRQYGEGAYYVLEMNGAPSDLIEDVVGAYNNAIPTEEVDQGYAVATRYVDKSKMQPFNEDVINRVEKYAHDVADGMREFNDALKGKFRPDKAEFFGQDKSPTYEVSVNAEQDELLDWNKDLDEQSGFVKKALNEGMRKLNMVGGEEEWDGSVTEVVGVHAYYPDENTHEFTSNPTGGQLYEAIVQKLGSQAKASDYLQSLGIVGHKYAASGGRNDKHPNYVIYDDSRIETNYVHFNAQSAEIPVGDETLTDDQKAEIRAAVTKRLGEMELKLSKGLFGTVGGKRVPLSADWGPGSIRIAANIGFTNAMQAAMHEGMHEFFDRLGKEEAGKAMLAKLLSAANSASVVRQLERLLADHPNAKMQIKEGQPDFENERLAYMYQFWYASRGMDKPFLVIGPETKTIFQRIFDYLRGLTKLLSDDQQAELILQAFDEGRFSDKTKTSVVAKAVMEDLNARRNMVDNVVALAQGPLGKARELVVTAHTILAESGVKEFKELANMFDVKQGERAHDGKQGMFEARKQMSSQFLNKLKNVLDKLEKKDAEAVLQALFREDGVPPKDMKQYEAYRAIRGTDEKPGLLDELHDYFDEAGVKKLIQGEGARKEWVKVHKREHYFPVVWELDGKEAEFAADLVKYHQREIMGRLKEIGEKDYKESAKHVEYAKALAQRLTQAHGARDLSEVESSLGFSPLMTSINERTLDWITAPEMSAYRSQDLKETMTSYIMQAVKRAEYVRRFGNGAAVIKDKMLDGYTRMLAKKFEKLGVVEAEKLAQKVTGTYSEIFVQDGAVKAKKDEKLKLEEYGVTQAQVDKAQLETMKEIKPFQKAVMAMEGTLGHDISENLRSMSNAMIVYQNFRLLAMTLFSSMSDPLGIVVRGGDIDDAYQTMQRGFKEVWKRWKSDSGTDDATALAEMIGSVDAGMFAESLGQTYSSLYMSGKTKWLNDQLFKWNGMEAWNRGMRVGATQAAIKFIKKHLTKPNKDSERFLKELFPEGFRPELTDGELNYTDPLVQQAIMRWVDGAILSPNAAQRPMWASDPHYGLFFHMKQFAYSYHRTILKRAWDEAVVHGNAAPTLTLIVGYVPLVIAADAAKSIILSGGDEPYWMQKGVGSTLWHGMTRANLAGIPQIGLDGFGRTLDSKEGVFDATLEGVASVAGPTTGWAKDWYDKPVGDQLVKSLPLGSVVSSIGGQGVQPSKQGGENPA